MFLVFLSNLNGIKNLVIIQTYAEDKTNTGVVIPENTGTGDIVNKEEIIEDQQKIKIITKLYFYEKNHLGTPIALTDKLANIVEEYETDEFGNVLEGEESELNTIFFTGKILDTETGLYFYNARYYSPSLGRFMSRDPYEGLVDSNLYVEDTKEHYLKYIKPIFGGSRY